MFKIAELLTQLASVLHLRTGDVGRTNQNKDLVEHNEPIHGTISCCQLLMHAESDIISVTLGSIVWMGGGP